jgi:hypothetical protein
MQPVARRFDARDSINIWNNSKINIMKNKTSFKILCGLIISSTLIISNYALGQNTFPFAHPTAANIATPNTGTCTGSDIAKGITTDGSGNSYVVGTFTGSATFISSSFLSAGSNDVFLEKYDRIGNPLWAVRAGGTGDDDAKSVAVYPDGAGGVNIYVTGYFTSSITFNGTFGPPVTINSVFPGNVDMYIVKYRNDGSVWWAQRFGRNATSGFTIGYDIAVSENTYSMPNPTVDIWVCGSFKGTVSFGTHQMSSGGGQNGFIANFHDGSTAPNDVWVNGILSTSLVAQAEAICPDQSGNVFLSGYWLYGNTASFGGAFNGIVPNGNDDGFVAGYDGLGAIQNLMHFGHTAGTSQGTNAIGVAVAEDGNVYVAGCFTHTTIFQSSPLITLTSTGGPVTGCDAFLMKLDPASLAVDYVNQMSSPTADDVARRVVVDHCGKRAYVSGNFFGTENFGNGVTQSTSVNFGESAFIVDFDISNPFVANAFDASRIGGSVPANTTVTIGYDLAVNSVEDVELCGSFSSGNLVCAPSAASNGNSSNAVLAGGTNDGFIARWDDNLWPALETTAQAINQGVSSVNCIDYTVGDMSGNNVTFGTLPSLSAIGFSDVYLLALDKYATYTSFKKLTNGTSTETSVDLVSNSSNHFIAGNATPSIGQTVTFTLDAADSYTATAANAGPTAVVMRTNLGGLTGWGTTVRPVSGGAATGKGVAYDASGNVYFCGYFSGTVGVYSTGGSWFSNLISNGSNDIFVIKYSPLGIVQWAKKIGGSSDDHAHGISVDPSSSNYYITGQVSGTVLSAQGLAHTHFAPITDGFVLRGSLSTGAAINDAFWTTASVANWGNDIYSNDTSEVYVTGVKTANKVYIASFDLSGTSSPVSPTWNLISTGGTAFGNDIILGRNGYVYVSGELGSTSATFGSLPAITSPNVYGGYIVGLTSWGGTPTWETTAYTNAKFCNGLAEDVGYLMSDHGFICLICGQNDMSVAINAYVQKATEEGLEFSSRHANPSLTENNIPIEFITSAVYPNPFDQAAILKLDQDVDLSVPASLLVFDVSGRIVNRIEEISQRETTISAEGLSNGIYFYKVIQNGNILTTGKMMINK